MKNLGLVLGSSVLAAKFLRELDQRFLVAARERLLNNAQNEDAGELQTLGGVYGHQLHGILRLAADVPRSQRCHRIVVSTVFRQAAIRFLKKRDILQKFAQGTLASDLPGLAAPIAGKFLKALQWERVAELERATRDPYRSRQHAVRVGEIVPSFADRLHHFKSTGNF